MSETEINRKKANLGNIGVYFNMKIAQLALAIGGLLLFLFGTTGGLTAANTEAQTVRVRELLQAGKAQAAIDTLTGMRLQSLEDPELYFLLGKANLGIRDYKNAEVAFKMALYFKHAYPEANFELGLVKLQLNLPNEAVYFFDQAVRQRPEWEEAVRKLGECYFRIGRFDPALDAFNQLIKKNPQDFISYYFVGQIRKTQDLLDAAVWNFQECLKIKPDYIPALQALSQIYLNSDRPDDALLLFNQILKHEPDSLRENQSVADLFVSRGKQRLEQENLAGAAFDFQNVQLIFPEDVSTRQMIREIDRRTLFDSLKTQALHALTARSLEDAQLLFTKALVVAKDSAENTSVTAFLDSLQTILNEQRYEGELKALSAKAENAFSAGDYEQALSLYQKVILLNPSDQFSQAAFRESGSLKYFVEAIREWNNENWESALKNFDRVVAYYPNFPQMKNKYQALQQIKQLENQQLMVLKALETGSYTTARDIFVKIFKADAKNSKLAELSFQITALGSQQRIQSYLQQAAGWFGALLILAGGLWYFFWRQRPLNPYAWKIAGLTILMVFPTLLLVGAVIFSLNWQKPTEVELQVSTDHASFLAEPDQKYEIDFIADSVALQQISQLRLEQIQLQSKDGRIHRQLQKPETFPADTLKEPLSLGFKTGPVLLTNGRFACPTKIVLRPGQRETGMTLVPLPVQKNFTTWFRGEIPVQLPFHLQIPVANAFRADSLAKDNWLPTGSYLGTSLSSQKGLAKIEARESQFQIHFSQPASLKFHRATITDLSFKRFFPGENSVRIMDGFQSADLSFFLAGTGEKKMTVKQPFHVFPNRFMLQKVENRHGKLTLRLTGVLTHLELQDGKTGKEIIPNYFSWFWQKAAWLILTLGFLWLVLILGCVAFLVRVYQQRLNEMYHPEVNPPAPAAQSIEQLMQNIHGNWAQNLNQVILPKWQHKISAIEMRLNQGNHLPDRDELVSLLQRSEQIFQERKHESDKYSSGERNE